MSDMISKAVLSFGEILWDLLPSGAKLGGAPFNFAYRMHTLGMASHFVSRVGHDNYGERALDDARELGMDAQLIQIDDDHPTGTVNVYLDKNKNPDYYIVPDVAYDFVEINDALLQNAEQMDCICFGSLAQRNPQSRYTLQAILEASAASLIFLDINLRKDCFSQTVLVDSLEAANALKLNEDELEYLQSIHLASGSAPPEACYSLVEEFGLQFAVVTLGERGAFAVGPDGTYSYCPGFQVDVADPCGSGDAFAAGFLYQLFQEKTFEEACEFGNALGALVAKQDGATGCVEIDEVLEFIQSKPKRITDTEF